MSTETIAQEVRRHCAPLLAGIKPSNLLILERGHKKLLDQVLHGSRLQCSLLCSSGKNDFWLIYEEDLLERLIHKEENAIFLRQMGYLSEKMTTGAECRKMIILLGQRFSEYKKKGAAFPHEMGVFLGYPLKDVQGFILHQGQDFKASGYWKVYDDVIYADQMFRKYRRAGQVVEHLSSQGFRISEICRLCRADFEMAGRMAV